MRGDRNHPLFLGGLLALLFLALTVAGPMLAPHDPMAVAEPRALGNNRFEMPPFRPLAVPGFPLGTDHIGRDLLSRILWGIRPTMLLCGAVALVRLIVGTLLGLAAGWFRGTVERAVDTLSGIAIAIPMLIFSIAAISIFGLSHGLWPFIGALAITGWADTALLVKNRTLTIAQAPYIESARAIGVTTGGMLRRHLFPQLWPLLPALLAFELSAVLLLAAELGFLGIYIGGGFLYHEASKGETDYVLLTAGYPELGQLLSDVWVKILRTPWDPLFVGLSVAVAIFAFNLLGEGLRRATDVTRARRH